MHLPEVECEVAVFDGLQLVVRLEVGEAPQPAVDDVREALLLRDLKSKKLSK